MATAHPDGKHLCATRFNSLHAIGKTLQDFCTLRGLSLPFRDHEEQDMKQKRTTLLPWLQASSQHLVHFFEHVLPTRVSPSQSSGRTLFADRDTLRCHPPSDSFQECADVAMSDPESVALDFSTADGGCDIRPRIKQLGQVRLLFEECDQCVLDFVCLPYVLSDFQHTSTEFVCMHIIHRYYIPICVCLFVCVCMCVYVRTQT